MRLSLVLIVGLGIALVSCAPSSAIPATTSVATAAPVASAAALTSAPTVVPTAAIPSESAGAFWTRMIELSFKAEWGTRWDALLPVHQAVVTRERYIKCSLETQPLTGTPQITVLSSREEQFGLPAAGLETATTTLVTMTLVDPGHPPLTFGSHAWNVDGRWRWALNATEYGAFKNSTACK